MRTLSQQLRDMADHDEKPDTISFTCPALYREAADRIDELEASIAEATKLLNPPPPMKVKRAEKEEAATDLEGVEGKCPHYLPPEATKRHRCEILELPMGPQSDCIMGADDEGRTACPIRELRRERNDAVAHEAHAVELLGDVSRALGLTEFVGLEPMIHAIYALKRYQALADWLDKCRSEAVNALFREGEPR